MKVLIVSDSHGLEQELKDVFELHRDADLAFHCGDSQLHGGAECLYPYRVVKGNCDYGNDFPDELVEETDFGKIFCIHGHRQDVKYDLNTLRYKALERGADVVLFGHTHVAGAAVQDGVLFINPGSIRMPRHRPDKTHALLEVKDGRFTVHFFDMTGEEINALYLDGDWPLTK